MHNRAEQWATKQRFFPLLAAHTDQFCCTMVTLDQIRIAPPQQLVYYVSSKVHPNEDILPPPNQVSIRTRGSIKTRFFVLYLVNS